MIGDEAAEGVDGATTSTDPRSGQTGAQVDPAGRDPGSGGDWMKYLTGRLGRTEELTVAAVLVAMTVGVGIAHPHFLSIDSLGNIGQQAAFFGIIALGMVFLLAMREIDLSVGGTYEMCLIVAARLITGGMNPWLAAVIAIVVGMGLSGLNAVIAGVFRIQLIIVTLGTLSVYGGLALILAPGGSLISITNTSSSFFTILGNTYLDMPIAVWVALALAILLTVVFTRTRLGFAVRAVGSNERAAQLAGYSVFRIRLRAELLVGALCGVAAMLTLGFLQSADPNAGQNFEIQTVAAAVIGGTGLAGGSGSVPGAVIGALIISVIAGGLVQFGVSPNWGSFITGVVIVGAVSIDALLRRRKSLTQTA
jgi:ribose transport system permease protein